MPFIEGIGDEVTIILGAFFLCIILMFAWLSTHTADIPLLREVGVIVVELSQRRSRTQNAVSEEPIVRDDADGSIEHGNASGNGERQQSEADIRAEEISESHLIAGATSENNTIAAGARTSASPSSDESASFRGATDATASSGLSTGLAEVESIIPDQAALSSSSQTLRRNSGDDISPNHLKEPETLIPKASVVVDDSKGVTYPTEEEIRQRRVQYFQANKPTEGGNGETHSSPDDNKPTSLSELSSPDSGHTRHLVDNSHSSYLPSTVGATLEDSAISSRTYHPASTPTAGSNSIAANSPDEDINDSRISEQENAPSSKIRVKLKYMNETQRLVYAEPLDTIGDFRRAHFQAELEDNKWVRFIYNGQDLRDDARTLQACNVGDNCTMHCLITTQTQSHMPQAAAAEEDEDSFMGAMMYPLFSVIILIVWYFRFTYRQYFSAMSTVCLIGISFLLALSYISSLRTTSDRIPPQRRLGPTTPPPPGVEVREEHQHVD